MPREARAILFDLDDTLYPLERFVLSGFTVVAAYLESQFGIDAKQAMTVLVDARRRARGRELQCCVAAFQLPVTLVPSLVDLIRSHRPKLRMPAASVRVLASLGARFRLGVVTNGLPDLQRRKVDALGLQPLVDTIVYAHETGSRVGKPDAAPFLAAMNRLGVTAADTIFVGDDLKTDIAGASRLQIPSIHATARTITRVPAAINQLICPGPHRSVHGL